MPDKQKDSVVVPTEPTEEMIVAAGCVKLTDWSCSMKSMEELIASDPNVSESFKRSVADSKRLDWLDTLQERMSEPMGHNNQRWHLTTDIHANHGRWSLYVRNSRGDIVQWGQGVTFREAVDAAIDRAIKEGEGR